MAKSKPTSQSRVNNLLAAIKQQAPTSPKTEPETQAQPETGPALASLPSKPEPISPDAPARKEAKSRAGKPVQFWIHEEDRLLLRELSAWLAGQGERPTDSMVIRSALRVAKTGGEFLKAYRQASQLDGRLKPRKSA